MLGKYSLVALSRVAFARKSGLLVNKDVSAIRTNVLFSVLRSGWNCQPAASDCLLKSANEAGGTANSFASEQIRPQIALAFGYNKHAFMS